jgi:cytochrome b561
MVVLRTPAQKAIFLTLILLVVGILLVFLMVVRGFLAPTQTAPASTSSVPRSNTSANAAAAATAAAYMKLVTIVGQPSVKIISGTTFEADGHIKNADTFQHDITLKITLLDASSHIVGTATHMVDNVKGGATVSYAIQGTASQSSWSSVELAVIKVTENIIGTGGD